MDQQSPNFISPIFVALLGIMSAAVVLTIYHCVVMTWCNPQRSAHLQRRFRPDAAATANNSMETSATHLIPPTQTYGKSEGSVSGGESVCPVCLCEFRDGEAVRLLPDCMHYFHVPCIDMWLQSHANCPMCRTEITPVSGPPPASPEEQQSSRGAARTVVGAVTIIGV